MDDYVTKSEFGAAMERVDERFSKLETAYGEMSGEIAEIRHGIRKIEAQQNEQQEMTRDLLRAVETQQNMLETQQNVTGGLVRTVEKMQESIADLREDSAETRGMLNALGPALTEKLDAGREAMNLQIAQLRTENEHQLERLRRENEQGLAGVRLEQERGRTFAHRIAATYAAASVAVVSAVAGALRAFG